MTRDYAAAVRAGDVIDFCDRIWANAARAAPGHSGSAPSRVSPSRPFGECPFREERDK
jgi:hypothetical protein